MTPHPIVPVILSGGAGARLWPLSTEDRPKPFLPLLDGRSTFEETLARAAAIPGVDTVLIVANVGHREILEAETASCGLTVEFLLEPAARDSAAAIAAAAEWLARRRPDAVAAFISADHHIPDAAAFADAVSIAARAAADHGVVTLGLRPTTPSTAFGYIRPLADGAPVARVGAFVEKPDRETAERYMAAGYLWNSGNFICRPRALIAELEIHAPAILAAARAALSEASTDANVAVLGPSFTQAPATSIDRAVMERTTAAAVLPVGFGWSDIGSWRAVLEASERDSASNSVAGEAHLRDCSGCLVRVPSGRRVVLLGLRDVAVVANADGDLLVCDLASSEEVRHVASALRAARDEGSGDPS